ncbi:MAG: acyl-CoA desaturase, partial [Actinomycetota bacterium]|nr:acyl-CoA desaturase [Actinomycetota bacterium]
MSAAELSPSRQREGSDFTELSKLIKSVGLLDRRPGYYAVRIATNFLLLAGAVTAFVLLGDSWWQLLNAAFVAFVLTQFAFMGHDAGHRQIFT